MEWRSGDRYLGGGGFPGGDGYGYTRDSHWSSPGSGMPPYDGGGTGSYYDRPEWSGYDYPEPEGGYERGWEQRPPHRGQPGWRGDPRGGFRGNSGPTPSKRRKKRKKQPNMPKADPEGDELEKVKYTIQNFFFGGGFKVKRKHWKILHNNIPEAGQPAPKKRWKRRKSGSKEGGNAREAAQSTTTEIDQEDGRQKETEPSQSSSKQHQETEKKIELCLINGIQYYCYLCQFRTFYEEEYNLHMQSSFHKEHLEFVKKKLPSKSADVLQKQIEDRNKISKERCNMVEDLDATVVKVFRNRDFTLGLGMEQFLKKVDVAHCAACDMFLPMQFFNLQQHIKTTLHKKKCKIMMATSKHMALSKAMNALKYMPTESKLGQNPLNDDEETTRGGCSTDLSQMPCITHSDTEGEEDDDLQVL
ncbi:A-kinase anchor protein 8-like isoform X2 [Dendropsophus ebraccatus]|uniref:A-kinase anchor protein 8-like isoform X2 n=1 Tax=Dendropsophus ebraccatus TaxID=150705 RepID=UPI0038322BD6